MKQAPAMSDLMAKARAEGYKAIALSLEDPGEKREKLADLGKNSTILVMPNLAIQRTFRATSIPLLVLVSGEGKVEWVHYGILSDAKFSEISTKLKSAR
jgi:hypothetical protein